METSSVTLTVAFGSEARIAIRSCSLEDEILCILEEDSPATVRQICAVVYPMMSWLAARQGAAEIVRNHCACLVRQHVLVETAEDTFSLAAMARA